MKYDKNQIIGISLLAILLFGYFYVTSTQQKAIEQQRKQQIDSMMLVKQDSIKQALKHDSINKLKHPQLAIKQNITLANKNTISPKQDLIYLDTIKTTLLNIVFSNKSAMPISVKLNQYNSFTKEPVELLNHQSNTLEYNIKTQEGKIFTNKDVVFSKPSISYEKENIIVAYTHSINDKEKIQHIYTINKNNYLLTFNIISNTLKTNASIPLQWQIQLNKQEKNADYERTQSQINFFDVQDNFDYYSLQDNGEEKAETNLKWMGIKQQFFNTTLLASNGDFKDVVVNTSIPKDSNILSNNTLKCNLQNKNNDSIAAMQWYFGPNDYDLLKTYNKDLERIINIGQGFYSFVKYVNKWLVIPIFNLLQSFVSNYGLVILLLTIIIKLITTPLMFSSYVSTAKMKLLKPDLDDLKKKYPDQQTFALKQMELYKSAGVNPLGGCLPALLQIPIFLSLYYFFNSTIDIRGESFLWATDLSSFDSIVDFSFNIPFYGNHVSLFTLLNVITSFLITMLNSNLSGMDQNNPALKYMPYIFPVVLLGFFNSLPSALTWYYTVSNTITLILQLFIQKYMINHDKLKLEMEKKKKAPVKKSVWLTKFQEMQDKQKQLSNKK